MKVKRNFYLVDLKELYILFMNFDFDFESGFLFC